MNNNYVGLYNVIQKQSSIFWGVTVSVTERKKVHMTTCVTLNGDRDTAV
jgi:hypothetical protein